MGYWGNNEAFVELSLIRKFQPLIGDEPMTLDNSLLATTLETPKEKVNKEDYDKLMSVLQDFILWDALNSCNTKNRYFLENKVKYLKDRVLPIMDTDFIHRLANVRSLDNHNSAIYKGG